MFMKICVTVLALLAWSTTSVAGDKGILGALIGAGVGAGVGHAVDRSGGSGKGAVIGAIGGYVIGSQMEKSESQAAGQPPAQQAPAQQGSALASSECASADQYVNRAETAADNDDKIYYLEKAVKLCPDHSRAHNDLGVAYYNRNSRYDRDRARTEFNEALRIDPGYEVARNNLNSL